MKIFIASAAVVMCMTAPSMAQSAKQVQIEACPEKGVPDFCVVVRVGEEVFNLTNVEPRVPVGKGIKLTGVVDTGTVSPCGGEGLKDVTWESSGLLCTGQADGTPPNLTGDPPTPK
jgi:hypothetical protein